MKILLECLLRFSAADEKCYPGIYFFADNLFYSHYKIVDFIMRILKFHQDMSTYCSFLSIHLGRLFTLMIDVSARLNAVMAQFLPACPNPSLLVPWIPCDLFWSAPWESSKEKLAETWKSPCIGNYTLATLRNPAAKRTSQC